LTRILVLLAACATAVATLASPAAALPDNAQVQTYKDDLDFPVDMAWVPGTKKIFFTEKNTGKIRVLVDRKLKNRACRNLDVDSAGEGGALGIALHPNFKDNHYLYVYWTSRSPLENRVTRFTVEENVCRDKEHIVKGIRANGEYHHGGQLEFAQGKLFVSVGEAHDPAEAQDTSNRLGKILRLNPDGGVPDGNPFNNEVWSYGHRNPFGLTHKPGTSKIYSTENGPNCDDELNHIKKGRNYGWGSGYVCGTAGVGTNPKPPIKRWSNIIVPTDPWWYRGAFGAMSGSLYVGAFGTNDLWRFNLNKRGTRVKNANATHTAPDGIVDVAKGPGGWLYYMTADGIRRIVKT
jgi:aldose sugar dehydrogenase